MKGHRKKLRRFALIGEMQELTERAEGATDRAALLAAFEDVALDCQDCELSALRTAVADLRDALEERGL